MNWNRILKLSLQGLFLLAVAAGYGFSQWKLSERLINGYFITIDGPEGLELVDNNSIIRKLENAQIDIVSGRPLNKLDLNAAELMLETMPHVSNAEVWASFSGKVRIRIEQRVPVLRIINAKQQSFYLDSNGLKMPLSTIGAYRVPIAIGNIEEKKGKRDSLTTPVGHQLWQLALFLSKNKTANALTSQIYVNDQEQLEIIPVIGNHTVVLGDTTALNDKFFKLEALYRDGFRNEDWNKYSLINLQFKELIVCQKAK